MKLLIPPTQSQLSTFLNSFDLISRFYNLFVSVRTLQLSTLVVQQANPVNGDTIQVVNSAQSAWLEILSGVALASLTIVLPSQVSLNDGQEILITSNRTITTLTLTAPGSIFNVTVSTLTANTSIRFKYSLSSNIWYKI